MDRFARGTGMKKFLFGVLLLGAAALPSPALAEQSTINQTIAGTRLDISATGEVTRVPDLAIISAGVITRSATASGAMDDEPRGPKAAS